MSELVTGRVVGGSTVVATEDAGPVLVLLSLLDDPSEDVSVLEDGPTSFLIDVGGWDCDLTDVVALLL